MKLFLLRAFSRYADETRALVTIQVVLFTVMLFGAIGMVIDFGRAYSAHSQMQSFIDQVALAAAAELDQQSGLDADGNPLGDDAIVRATNAANAVTKQSQFTEGGGAFQIAQVVYLTGAPTDGNGNFDYSLVTGGTLTTSNPALATHVLAIAQQASVRASLLDLNIGGASDAVNQIPIGTFAVATRRQVTCDGLSTLVMCNPFEDDPTRSLQSIFEAGAGFRMRLTAATSLGLSATATEIGLGLIHNPVATIGTDSGACEDVSTLPGYTGQTGAALQKLRDKCLLAVVDTGLSCVNDSLLVNAALPETVVTGLDARFDFWDDELAAVLTSDVTLASGQQRSEVFYPDIVSVHGRIRRDEMTNYYAAKTAAEHAVIDATPGLTPIQKTILKNAKTTQNNNARNALLAAYAGDANPASRLSHIPVAPGAHGPMESPVCFSTDCTSFGIHGGIFDSDLQPEDYATAYYTPRVTTLTAAAEGVPESSVTTLNGGLLTSDQVTFYGFYSVVERTDTVLQDYPASNGQDWTPATNTFNAGTNTDNFFVRTWPDNFATAYPAVDLTGSERRRVRVSVVNCGAAEAVTVDSETAYKAEVVDVVDLFLTAAPVVKDCTSTTYDSTTDPQGINPCANSDISKAELHVEYIGSVREDLESSKSRTYAVLVH